RQGRGEKASPMKFPKGIIHPKRILQQVVAGVRDYGNRMGIPTVNGAVYFHPDYLGNPLVYCGCIGLLPLDKCFGQTQPGDHIIALGGATGRDGIHGATFSSAELTDTHADEFSHAVQIGNAITQKKTLDVILQARDTVNPDGSAGKPLFNAITDCGAGGFSSAVGEMGKELGATVYLDRAPLKYQGLSYTEIWISEAQERMVLAVPPVSLEKLRALCAAEDVDFCDLGEFGCTNDQGQPVLKLHYQGTQVGELSMQFLHDGIPTPTREANWSPTILPASGVATSHTISHKSNDISSTLLALLAHPNIASKHWIIRQYDHEVQGGSVIKPLVGPQQLGPSDASVIRPKLTTHRGIALACGMAPSLSEKTTGGDSYWATLAAIDECVRNLVCVGVEPAVNKGGGIAILDNFCWPKCDPGSDVRNLGSLVRAAEACYDGAMAYRTPFVSGKDSLSNQFTTEDGRIIAIPPTLLITGLGMVPDVRKCRSMDAKQAGNLLIIVGTTQSNMGGSHYLQLTGDASLNQRIPQLDLQRGPATAQVVAQLIQAGLVQSAHDCSEGGLLVAAAEMAFAGNLGLDIDLDGLPIERELDDTTACFAESPSRYLLEVRPIRLGCPGEILAAGFNPLWSDRLLCDD
ncbi:MAG: phosphoribosylformylglycinamidine synthase, partial [Phycisphaerales bacterium]|nr:phosphoribosylformylglycinamidine synthase [Phycisphaerales bacterium]